MRKYLTAALVALALSVPGALLGHQAAPAPAAQGNPDARVWVNLPTHVYHCYGDRWYGKTKHGVYMKQSEARKKGNRPAYGRVCR